MDIINSKNYVDKAEAVIDKLIQGAEKTKPPLLTTSQIRNQLSMTSELQARVETTLYSTDLLSDEIIGEIENLRVQFIYQAGREASVKKFVEEANIKEILKSIGSNKADFLLFCRYMEALVAYRKYRRPDKN